MWTHTKESQDKISPQEALAFLKDGNLRFSVTAISVSNRNP
jgi:hypothetical protein